MTRKGLRAKVRKQAIVNARLGAEVIERKRQLVSLWLAVVIVGAALFGVGVTYYVVRF